MKNKIYKLTFFFNLFTLSFLSITIKSDDFVYKKVRLMGNKNHSIEALELSCIKYMKNNHFQAACAFECALEELKDPLNSFTILLDSVFLKKIFALDVNSLSQETARQIHLSQYLIVLRLYKVMFEQYIESAKSGLKDLVTAKNYWEQEAFFLSLPLSQRPVIYSTYSAQYKEIIFKNIKMLQTLEDEMAYILGICLYGFDSLEKLETTENIISIMHDAIKPLCQHYNIPTLAQSPTKMFDDLKYLQENMQIQMQTFKETLPIHQKPSFVVDHSYSLTAATAASLVIAYVCYQKADQIPGMLDRAKDQSIDFFVWYIKEPILELKRLLWDNPDPKDSEKWTAISECPKWEPSIVGIPTGAYDITGSVEYINTLSEKTLNPVVNDLNIIVPKVIDILKILRILMLIPVKWGADMAWSSCKTGYGSYMNNNYYLPIKYTLRSIDRLINSIAHGGHRSYSFDGKLYMLVLHLHHYADCLSHEEQMHLAQDIKDLLSFDLTYEQKKGVVDRMYRTYTCVQ